MNNSGFIDLTNIKLNESKVYIEDCFVDDMTNNSKISNGSVFTNFMESNSGIPFQTITWTSLIVMALIIWSFIIIARSTSGNRFKSLWQTITLQKSNQLNPSSRMYMIIFSVIVFWILISVCILCIGLARIHFIANSNNNKTIQDSYRLTTISDKVDNTHHMLFGILFITIIFTGFKIIIPYLLTKKIRTHHNNCKVIMVTQLTESGIDMIRSFLRRRKEAKQQLHHIVNMNIPYSETIIEIPEESWLTKFINYVSSHSSMKNLHGYAIPYLNCSTKYGAEIDWMGPLHHFSVEDLTPEIEDTMITEAQKCGTLFIELESELEAENEIDKFKSSTFWLPETITVFFEKNGWFTKFLYAPNPCDINWIYLTEKKWPLIIYNIAKVMIVAMCLLLAIGPGTILSSYLILNEDKIQLTYNWEWSLWILPNLVTFVLDSLCRQVIKLPMFKKCATNDEIEKHRFNFTFVYDYLLHGSRMLVTKSLPLLILGFLAENDDSPTLNLECLFHPRDRKSVV